AAALVHKESRLAAALVYKESRLAAAFRGIKYLKRRTSEVSSGAPSIASDPQVFQIPLLSHETWITSFELFAQSQYVLEINKFQAEI
ncbi:MAG: hypothetical protein OEZ11_11840, partial [Gammaproteobacteria bacterium]|nr:hypothetical protein [Gammaproteobacteria bacterium]